MPPGSVSASAVIPVDVPVVRPTSSSFVTNRNLKGLLRAVTKAMLRRKATQSQWKNNSLQTEMVLAMAWAADVAQTRPQTL